MCRSAVVPWRDAQGGLHCPACNDTGVLAGGGWTPTVPGAPAAPAVPVAPAAYGQGPGPGYAPMPPMPPYAAAPPNADGAVGALVLGILALVIPYIGFIFAFIALSMAKKALATISVSRGMVGGAGMAKAGRILSIVSLCIYGVLAVVIGAAVVFVLVSNLGAAAEQAPDIAFSKSTLDLTITVVQAEDGVLWSDLEIQGTAGCNAPFGAVDAGDEIDCARTGTVEIVHVPTNTLLYTTTFA